MVSLYNHSATFTGYNYPMGIRKFTLALFFVLVTCFSYDSIAQNSRIKCYFNHPVNTSISSGTDAVYLYQTFADTIAAYINRAKYTVDIAVYNFTSTASSNVARIATAANNAVNRGVVVRWIYDGSSTNSGLSLLDTVIKTIGSPTTSSYGIMHNKFMVIDVNSANDSDAIVMTGSCNFSSQQTNNDYNNIIFIHDKNVALAYYDEFNKMWGGTGASPNLATSAFGTHKTASAQNSFTVNGTPIEVYFSPKDAASTHLKNAINSADYDLFFGIYTFTDNTVANAIKTRIINGVSAKGIIDTFSASQPPYTTLRPVLDSNLIVYSGSYLYHNKIMLIDAAHPASDPQVLTGSYNWSYSGTSSNDENAVVIHDASITNQYLQSLCQNFATFGGVACTSTLPLQLLSFKATLFNNRPVLQWSVAEQAGTKYFVVEKSSDGSHFSAIGNINTLRSSTHYEFIDEAFLSTSYYRIRCVDYDGRITMSGIVALTPEQKQEMIAYPNPASERLFVQVSSTASQAASFIITDATGKVLTQQATLLNPGINSVSFITSTLARGTYLLLMKAEGETSVLKFIKQ